MPPASDLPVEALPPRVSIEYRLTSALADGRATYRWERATQIDPTYAAAFNNLAVAYEHEGLLEKAGEAYERALKLEPNNPMVRQNFELFKEIHDRTNQSQTP